MLQALQTYVQCDTSKHYHNQNETFTYLFISLLSPLFFMRYIKKLIKLEEKKKDFYFLESPKSPYLTYICILVKSSEQSPRKQAITDIYLSFVKVCW